MGGTASLCRRHFPDDREDPARLVFGDAKGEEPQSITPH